MSKTDLIIDASQTLRRAAAEIRRLNEVNSDLLEALKGLHHVCEIALAGKNGEQHVYFETRLGHFVAASESMRLAESVIANATGESE